MWTGPRLSSGHCESRETQTACSLSWQHETQQYRHPMGGLSIRQQIGRLFKQLCHMSQDNYCNRVTYCRTTTAVESHVAGQLLQLCHRLLDNYCSYLNGHP
jgi:hypothetical protein